MAPETRANARRGKTPPHASVLSQVERILAHKDFRDRPVLPELLIYLVDSNRAGRWDPPFTRDKPRPTGKLIVEEVYNHRFKKFMEDPPTVPALAGKKLVGQLRRKLKKYYAEHPDPKTHGHVSIVIPEFRGTAYRPQIGWLDTTSNGDANAAVAHSGLDKSYPAPVQEQAGGLAAHLNARLAFLNDPEFGHEMERYFAFAASHGIYCHDLRTTFTVREVDPKRFPTSAPLGILAETCFDLGIKEAMDKICAPDRLRFAVFRHRGLLAHHFVKPEVDFVWQIGLPKDAHFAGKISQIFRIDLVEVDGSTIVSDLDRPAVQNIDVVRNDHQKFFFEIDVSKIPIHGPLRKLRYAFHTLQAKDHRFVAHGTRVLTRGMTLKIEFGPETGIQSVVVQPSFSGDDTPKPSEFEDREISVSGWLLPRSGATFSFRYDNPYR